MEIKTDIIEKMATLSKSISNAIKNGYTEKYRMATIGFTTEAEERYYSRTEIRINTLFHFEGNADPKDNAILYLIETSDRKKGILIDGYGTHSEGSISTFIRALRNTSAEIIKIRY